MILLKYILPKNRWITICFYLLPVSLFYDICSILKTWFALKLYKASNDHDNKIRNIQQQINNWIKSGRKKQICISSTGVNNFGGLRPVCKNDLYNVKVNLSDILEINKEKKTVRVEPLVTIEQLTSALLPLGWTIPVVPGIRDLTIGGLVMGSGRDSSSHKYGLFHNICVSYELVLSDGSLVKCSRDENAELFYAVPWSYGTLGVLTSVEIQLLTAHNFVKMKFKAYHNKSVGVEKFLEECGDIKNDFVEGLMYTDNQCVIVTGQMVDHIEPNKLNELGKWYKPWFFLYVKTYFTKGTGIEYVPLKDYYYRHSKSLYWELQSMIPFGNNIFFRFFFGWVFKLSYLKLTQKKLIEEFYDDQLVRLDLMVPAEKLNLTVDILDSNLSIYPIWLCPFYNYSDPGFVHSRNSYKDLYVNVGIYGTPKAYGYHPQNSLKKVKQFMQQIKGFTMFYGDLHLSEEEFRQQFDHTLYDQVRKKINCNEAFPNIYDKINSMKNENSYYKWVKDCL